MSGARRGRDGHDLCVESLDPVVPVLDALFAGPVGFAHGVVDVDERDPLARGGPGPDLRDDLHQPGQGPRGDGVELAHVPERERP